jgi:hypothetical protein
MAKARIEAVALVGESLGGAGASAKEGVGGLNSVDMGVQVVGQRPGWGTRNLGAILVFEDVVLGVEKLLNGADRE